MNELLIFVCRVDTPEGSKDYVTLISPKVAFSQGLAPEAIVGVLLRPLAPQEPITPQVFARNRVFVEFMHAVVAQHGPVQGGCQAEAKRLGEGWIYIIDRRTPTPGGPVPPEDIIGAFKVKHGEVVPGSYRPSDKHMILSARGFFQLDGGLQECLLRELAAKIPEVRSAESIFLARSGTAHPVLGFQIMVSELASILGFIGGTSVAIVRSKSSPTSSRRLLSLLVAISLLNLVLLGISGFCQKGDDFLTFLHALAGHLMLPLVATAAGLWLGASSSLVWRRPFWTFFRLLFLLLLCFLCLSNTWTGYFGPSRFDARVYPDDNLRFLIIHRWIVPVVIFIMLLFWLLRLSLVSSSGTIREK